MFGGAYVVDNYALAFKGFFIVVAYITILLSVDYINEGDYYQGEFYFLLLTSVLGMSVMASGRDLITLFVALETISIPTYVLAGYRKHDRRSNEAGIKYYLIGVLSSAVMLYGMSLIFGLTGQHDAQRDLRVDRIARRRARASHRRDLPLDRRVRVQGRARCPSTSGLPTPTTARPLRSRRSSRSRRRPAVSSRCSTSSSSGSATTARRGGGSSRCSPAFSMTLGNLAALRQTNLVRMLAYSSIAQGGFLLVPVRGLRHRARRVGAELGVPGDDRLPAHLRRDEPRRVRGAHRGGPPHPFGRDLLLRGTVLARRPVSRSR